jgi:methyl-accepting chemotaxis protein
MPKEQEGWHLSRSVPATLLLGLATQAAAIVWTVSMMMSDIDRNSQDIAEFNNRMQKVEASVQTLAISMARIDANIEHIRTSVSKMASR